MAEQAPKSCDCGWLCAMYEKLEKDKKRVEEETKHLKDLLWKSGDSWREKEDAIEEDIVRASEEVVNAHNNHKTA